MMEGKRERERNTKGEFNFVFSFSKRKLYFLIHAKIRSDLRYFNQNHHHNCNSGTSCRRIQFVQDAEKYNMRATAATRVIQLSFFRFSFCPFSFDWRSYSKIPFIPPKLYIFFFQNFYRANVKIDCS